MLIDRLQDRVKSNGATPLIIYYDLVEETRIELSAKSFANWVDKTVNFMTTLDIMEGSKIGLALLTERPEHWVGLVWAMASWQHGSTVIARPRSNLSNIDLAVISPANVKPVAQVTTVACSLKPFGQPLDTMVENITDFADVLAESDLHWSSSPINEIAYCDDTNKLSFTDLENFSGSPNRQLLTPVTAWQAITQALIPTILGDGSIVLVRGGNTQQKQRIAHDEKIKLTTI